MAKIEVFTVKNNKDGQKFIELIRKYLNRDTYAIRVRGRHHDRRALYKKLKIKWDESKKYREVKIKDAETLAVYLDLKKLSGFNVITDSLKTEYKEAMNNANISTEELADLKYRFKLVNAELAKLESRTEHFKGKKGKGITRTKSRKIHL